MSRRGSILLSFLKDENNKRQSLSQLFLFVFFYFSNRIPSSPLFFHVNSDVYLSFNLTCKLPSLFYLQLSSPNKFVILHADAGLYRISHYTMMKLIIGSGKIKIIFNCNLICRILAHIENAVESNEFKTHLCPSFLKKCVHGLIFIAHSLQVHVICTEIFANRLKVNKDFIFFYSK